jgi:hypothetical protein
MPYLKQSLSDEITDTLRANLSVREKKLSAEPVCDFCGDHPVVIYAASRMSTGQIRQCWRWCACPTCERLVDSDQWAEVQNRLISKLMKMLPGMPRKLVASAAGVSLHEFIRYAVRK